MLGFLHIIRHFLSASYYSNPFYPSPFSILDLFLYCVPHLLTRLSLYVIIVKLLFQFR